MPKRCALGCTIRPGVSYHQFPHLERNPDRFKVWVHIVGGKLETPSDYEYYRKKVICDIHFHDSVKNRNNRLNFMAIPTLHLKGLPDNISPTRSSSVPQEMNHPLTPDVIVQPSIVSTETATDLTHDITPTTSDTMWDQPSTSRLILPASSILSTISPTMSSMPVPELNRALTPVTVQPSILSTEIATGFVSSTQIMTEHCYCRQPGKNVKKAKKTKYLDAAPPLIREQLQTSRRKLKNLSSELNRLRKRSKSFKSRLASALQMSKDRCMLKIAENMTTAAKIFTKMQMQNTKKSKGRRFTLEEKVLSLSIYKKSPKCYTLLSSYFTLPSSKSLKRIIAQIKIESGLNKELFLKMRATVKHMDPKDRLCCLLFDEMSITPQIHYDAAQDKLKGFAWRNKKFADHVLVYMVKGIRKNFKQPVAYYFTNCLNKNSLKEITISVIKYVQGTGLNIMCTVCDQSTTNVSTVNELINDTKRKYLQQGREWRHEILEVGGKTIIPLFDVPHLIKGIRNNLLNKDLKYYDFDAKVEKVIKWEYYQQVYEADKSYGELKLLQKLTDEHVYIQKMKKMKVKTAAQVFSHSVAVATEHLTARGVCAEECRQIIKFTKLMDNLFDSLNASTFQTNNGKIYKSCIRRNSPHHQLWIDALNLLKTVKFVKCKNNQNLECTVPSINNFIRTIEGIRHLWQILSQKYAFDAMLTRNFNQDPLENFFGNIRSYGIRNTAPNTINFEGAYKSLLLNNFNTPHSIKGNCENDDNNALQTLDFFLREKSNVPNDEVQLFPTNENEEIVVPRLNIDVNEPRDVGQANYVCGWVLAKCLKHITKGCKNCKKDMVGDKNTLTNAFIKAKEYKINAQCLVYPSIGVEKCFAQLQELITNILKENVPKNKIKEKINMFADIMVEYPFTCQLHKKQLIEYFNKTCINVLIYSWCRTVNRILSGKIQYNGEDEIKIAALLYYKKHMHNK